MEAYSIIFRAVKQGKVESGEIGKTRAAAGLKRKRSGPLAGRRLTYCMLIRAKELFPQIMSTTASQNLVRRIVGRGLLKI
ncbi:MAG: hypothetical protein A2Z86_05840 [Candidatus Glassbacteria bacterium GWA2_58_10]|uniref:Uncharacterized protein n=1 Tax=Candidatus Glassbacteria bacterium GWA2_58_10 TaxID=1817865 RepID=A0A1F5YEI3_9BACT|nr:MAG: hypothetical protein A2Z86_05840 [Candidatus Glassbacteria bacterium GWA2_58_10]